MIRRILFLGALGLMSVMSYAELSVEHIFLTMPDSICPYIGLTEKRYLLEYANEGIQLEVENLYGGYSKVIEKTNTYFSIEATKGFFITILSQDDGFYCILTACAPVCSSVVNRYIGNWIFLERVMPDKDAPFMRAQVQDGRLVWIDETPEEELEF